MVIMVLVARVRPGNWHWIAQVTFVRNSAKFKEILGALYYWVAISKMAIADTQAIFFDVNAYKDKIIKRRAY